MLHAVDKTTATGAPPETALAIATKSSQIKCNSWQKETECEKNRNTKHKTDENNTKLKGNWLSIR